MNDKYKKKLEFKQIRDEKYEKEEMLIKVNETIISLNSLSVQPSTVKSKGSSEDKKNSDRARSLKRFSPYQSPRNYCLNEDIDDSLNRGRSNSFHCKYDDAKFISNKNCFRNRRHTLGSLDSLCSDEEKSPDTNNTNLISINPNETIFDNSSNTNSLKNGVNNIANNSCSFEMCKKPKYSEDADFIGEMDELSDYFNHFVGVEMKMSSLAESMYA
uniref:Oxidative stress-responsive protein 1 n=1 Tax=Strongyloides papillosus TaxID=174720 RepID=A0A0N5BWA3_STREA